MKKLFDNKGMAFVNVILAMVIAVILVTAMMTLSLRENVQAIDQSENMKAYYIARSGAETMVHRLKTIEKEYWDDFTTEHTTIPIDYSDGSMTVKVKRSGSIFNVLSNGFYNGESQNSEAELIYNPNTNLEYALFSNLDMTGLNLGDLYYYIGSNGEINFGNQGDEGLYEEWTMEYQEIEYSYTEPSFLGLSNATMDLSIETNNTHLTDTGSISYENIETGNSNSVWQIDVDGADFKKYINEDDSSTQDGDVKFKVIGSTEPGYKESDENWLIIKIEDSAVLDGDIEIIDSHPDTADNLVIVIEDYFKLGGELKYDDSFIGNVEIYVTDKDNDLDDSADGISGDSNEGDADLIINSPQVIAGGENYPSRLIFYLSQNSHAIISVNSEIHGYIIGPDAKVSLANGQTTFYGAIIANEIEVASNVHIYYDFPDGSNEIKLESIQFSHWIK